MSKEELLVQFPKQEDKYLVSRVLDKIQFVNTKNKIEFTDFLDEYQSKVVKQALNIMKISNYEIYGGYEEAERKMCIIYPDKLQEVFQNKRFDFVNIFSVIRILLSKEMYDKYSHRDYLGAIMKLGVKREKIGDIIVSKDGADILVNKDIERFLMDNLKELKRFSKSEIFKIKLEELRKSEIKFEELSIIVSSIRLDAVVGELLHVSRTKSLEIIKQERVFVNFEMENKSSKVLKKGDIITVRGKGRFIIDEQVGITKNKRIKLLIKKYI